MRPQSDGFEEKIIEIKRVSKKTKGGNKIRFTALAVVGDKIGKVGYAMAKALDVTTAISKALARARRDVIAITLADNTIPHEVTQSYKSSSVKMMPAPKGSGIIAGGAVREVLALCGVKDISAKMLGSNNKHGAVICTVNALKKLEKKIVKVSKVDDSSGKSDKLEEPTKTKSAKEVKEVKVNQGEGDVK